MEHIMKTTVIEYMNNLLFLENNLGGSLNLVVCFEKVNEKYETHNWSIWSIIKDSSS